MIHGVEREPVALQRIGADVREERIVDADDAAVPRKADRDIVNLLAVLAQRRQVLASRLHPLHRAPELQRGRRHQDVFGIDGALGPEAPADVGDDDPHVLGRKLEDGGDDFADAIGILSGRHHHERARIGVAVGEHAARLDRRPGQTRVADRLVHDDVGAGERRRGITDRATGDERGVVGPRVVDTRRRRHPAFGRRDRSQRLVFDRDGGERVGHVHHGVSDHDRDGLADVARDGAGEHGHGVRAPAFGATRGDRARDFR